MKKDLRLLSIFLVLVFIFPVYPQEFDISEYRSMYSLSTYKKSDNSRLFELSFLQRNRKDRKDRIPVFDATINFYNVLEEERILLGSAKTDQEGIARLSLPEDQSYLTDENGYFTVEAIFEGSESIDEELDEISLKDIHLQLNLVEIDSIRTVQITGTTRDSIGKPIAVDDVDVIVSVKGMLSKLPIAEETIEDGELEVEFPPDLPGDVNNNLMVMVTIEDDDDYGNVETSAEANWGTPMERPTMKDNSLWSEVAPIWMYVVLTVLLVGVWANYVYTIINLLKIRKEGRKLQSDTNT